MPMKRAALLLTSLILAACGQQAPLSSGSQPSAGAQPGTGDLYEITFQGVGGPHPTSTAAVLGRSALGTQTLSDASSGTFTFTPLGVDTFRTGNTRHIRAVYRVTNNTSAPIGHLVFVPVNTDDSDGDPATVPSTAPTVGATYFKDLTTFGATDASGRAADLTPTTGKMLGAQGTAAFDPASTPYVASTPAPSIPRRPLAWSWPVVRVRAGVPAPLWTSGPAPPSPSRSI